MIKMIKVLPVLFLKLLLGISGQKRKSKVKNSSIFISYLKLLCQCNNYCASRICYSIIKFSYSVMQLT